MSKKNVILLSIDSLRFDRLGFGGHKPSPSPNIDRLMASGLSLTQCFATGCPTQFSMPGLHTSTLPLDQGGYNLGIRNRGMTLAEIFKESGYKTCALISGLALGRMYGYDKGFDDFFSFFDLQFFPKGFRNLYLRSIREGFKLQKIPLGACVEMLAPVLPEFLSEFKVFCLEKQKEVDAGNVLLSPIIHGWDFGLIVKAVESDQARLKSDPEGYVKSLLMKKEHESPFNFIPYGTEPIEAQRDVQVRIADQFFQQGGYGASRVSGSYIMSNALNWIGTNKANPFFVWVHLIDVHDRCFTSFDAPTSENAINEEIAGHTEFYSKFMELRDEYVGSPPYDFSLRYVDQNVGRLFSFLVGEGLVDNTLLVLTSDHGHLSAEWPVRQKIDIVDFFTELYHVPTVFLHPEIEARRIEGLTSTLDIGPTLLDFAGLPIPSEFLGTAVNRPEWKEREYVLMEHLGRGPCNFQLKPIHVCVRSKTQKAVCVAPPPADGKPPFVRELYDLRKDPYEMKNLAGSDQAHREFAELITLAEERIREVQKENGLVAGNRTMERVSHSNTVPASRHEGELRDSMYQELLQELDEARSQRDSLQKVCDERMKVIEELDRAAKERLSLIEQFHNRRK